VSETEVEQIRLLPGEDPDDLVEQAKARWSPVRTICLFSGGNDSSVVAHRCRDHYDELFFIDTGTAVPGVEEFVREFAEWIDKPLTIKRAGDAYRLLVLGGTLQRGGTIEPGFGFPGKGQHPKAYTRLKERQIEAKLKEVKLGHPRTASVLFVSGVRRDESARRSTRQPLTERFSAKFVNPLIDWTNLDMRRYRQEHEIPQSDPAALCHRSMECNCGAFADAEAERAMMMSLWPDWWETTIAPLEREAEARGIRWCRWGGYDRDGVQAAGSGEMPADALCADNCQTRMAL
jgi:3'-phosphoadenosine 5'-phosphosulfate sulfotransferase (PAPS reductase)/FAD synthetase